MASYTRKQKTVARRTVPMGDRHCSLSLLKAVPWHRLKCPAQSGHSRNSFFDELEAGTERRKEKGRG